MEIAKGLSGGRKRSRDYEVGVKSEFKTFELAGGNLFKIKKPKERFSRLGDVLFWAAGTALHSIPGCAHNILERYRTALHSSALPIACQESGLCLSVVLAPLRVALVSSI